MNNQGSQGATPPNQFTWTDNDATAKTIGYKNHTVELGIEDREYGGEFRTWWTQEQATAFAFAWLTYVFNNQQRADVARLLAAWKEKPHAG